ncbi:MAG TPA: NPCBM/NEW2 domain-containing protein [Candidatus Dormibacteraeota bacterium]|nr:NPCBM/NEW2 domain-containing protein [Candidatus Dormibacteraeota bacterium]
MRALALDNGLARTPYQGWNTFYGLGDSFDQATIQSVADAIVSRGLKAFGYRYVWIDGGWWKGTRDAAGNITVAAGRWPGGMKAVADYIHAKGLLAGIYTDAGSDGCGGAGQGSYGHYQQDANQFAAWGYDALKVDFCGGTKQQLNPADAYAKFRDALLANASHRPILFNICNPFTPGSSPWSPNYPGFAQSVYNSYSFGPSTGNSWRTDTDVGFVRNIQFRDVLRNLDHNASHPEAAGPGHWNDPDYLGPELGMTRVEAQTQFTMWSVSAAPLIIGSDVRALSQDAIDMLTNPDVLAINQDGNGVQGTPISTQGDGQVWVKALANGDRAVTLLNRGTTPLTISTDAKTVGMSRASRYSLHDLWKHSTTETAGRIVANVGAHEAVLYRVSPGATSSTPPAVFLSSPSTPAPYAGSDLRLAIPGQALPVTVTVENNGRRPIQDVQLTLAAPSGWSVQQQPNLGDTTGSQADQGGVTLATGEPLTITWSVTVPPGTLPGTNELVASVSYRWGRHNSAGATTRSSVLVPTAPPANDNYLSDHTWLDASSGYLVPRLDGDCCGGPISLMGTRYPKGIGVASPSQIEFYLGGNCTHLSAIVGIDDSARWTTAGATATFSVLTDGRSVFESGLVRQNITKPIEVDLTGASVLTLLVGDGGDGGYNDRTDWANLRATCNGPVATVPSGAWPHFVLHSDMTATASSANNGYPASNAIDGRLTTIWHSEFSPVHTPLPISLTIDTGAARTLTGLTYQGRLDGDITGTITGYTVEVSTDGIAYTLVASGLWAPDSSIKSAAFTATTARYLRLTATSAVNGYASAAEVAVSDIPAA